MGFIICRINEKVVIDSEEVFEVLFCHKNREKLANALTYINYNFILFRL